MTRRLLLLFALGLAVSAAVAAFQRAPGYMDADYYYMGGLNLAHGRGFHEQILWNYLDDPTGLPHPSHGYWMPLASLVAAGGLVIAPAGGYDSAQWGFILLAALVPPLTAALGYALHPSPAPKKRAATLAGLLAVFPGYYLGVLTTTDSFGIVMLLGAAFFLLLHAAPEKRHTPFLLGVLAALLHLSRADGVLWLGLAIYSLHTTRFVLRSVYSLSGYLLTMTPWFMRNITVFGNLLAPGGARALWLTRYDELFAFPAGILTPARWLASGAGEILHARLLAGWTNLQSATGVQGMVFLFPLVLWGLWRLRRERTVKLAGGMWLAIFFVMTVIFPFAGGRGGFFHSGAAVQPLLWAVVPAGLDGFVEWGNRRRGWKVPQARRVFGAGLVMLAAALSLVLGGMRLANGGASPAGHAAVEAFLTAHGAQPGEIVMVNNPPGWFVATGRPAIVIPDGGVNAVLAAGRAYGAGYLVLEEAQGLGELFHAPDGWAGLVYLGFAGGAKVFAFDG
jgi:hypothetical protein